MQKITTAPHLQYYMFSERSHIGLTDT